MVFIVILSSILLAVCTSLKPIYLQNAIDAVEAGTGDARAMFICYLVSILGILLFETARQLSTSKYRNGKLFGLKKQVMAHIIHMPPRKFQEEQGQNYVTTLNNEIEMLVDSFYVTRLELAYSILVLVACVVALLYINGYLAMIIIVSTVCPIVASAVQGQALEKRTNLYTMALEKLNVMIGNLIHGYPTIKVNHVEREYLQTLEQDNEKAAHAEFAKSKTKVRVNMIIGLLSYAGEAVMVGFSIYEIAKGRLSVGALVGALQLSEMLVIPTNSISYQLSEMRSVASIRQKISRLLSVPDSETPPAAIPAVAHIDLNDVSFRHEEKVILSHASYRFEAGKKYLILGENGSGKSTLFKLLTGLESQYEGCISVNGTDIRQLWPALYDRIGVVLQDAFLFDDTLLQNITLYRPELRERVEPVLHSLGMDAFLASHDLEQTFQNTKGNLSGGERQKLALARVLIENKSVIFLDEATANMDKDSSQKILSQLLQTAGLTVISIEHKVSPELLPLYDQILELKDAHLVESV
ncbi:MAG: ATP-binding cassette domain-containing protein [Oscillospiraceae bacterium]